MLQLGMGQYEILIIYNTGLDTNFSNSFSNYFLFSYIKKLRERKAFKDA